MYIAKENIGDYKKGETVPEDIAIIWDQMYLESPVQKVEDIKTETVKSKPKEEKVDSGYDMIDDYLARSQNVVKKNIISDGLSEEQLKMLLDSENANRKRNAIIALLKRQIGENKK